MNLMDKLGTALAVGVGFCPGIIAITLVSWFIIWMAEPAEPVDYQKLCWDNGELNTGYVACWGNPGCNLSNNEIAKMYETGKNAQMYCSILEVRRTREAFEAMDGQPPQKEEPKEELRAAE